MARKAKKEVRVRQNDALFDDLNFYEDDIPVDKPKPKLDMFRDILPAINSGDYGYYGRLSAEETKLYQPYVIQRWLSNAPGAMEQNYALNVNEFVNNQFWELSKDHAELQHMLMCVSAKLSNNLQPKPRTRHKWLAFAGGKRVESKVNKFLLKHFPRLRDEELALWKRETTVEEFDEFLRYEGVQEKEHKELMKLFKDEKKKAGV